MKFADSKIKSGIYTFLVFILIMFEMSILSGFRFVFAGGAKDRYGTGLSLDKVANVELLGKNLGWNYIVCSILIIAAMIGFALWLGYNRNFGGVVAMVIVNLLPILGLVIGTEKCFNFFWGYGTAHFLPTMALFGMHLNRSWIVHIIFIVVVLALTVGGFFVGKAIRAVHAAKYEYDD